MRIAGFTEKGRKAVMLLAVMLLTGIVLTACLKKDGEEFVGVWQGKKEPKWTAKISRTGGNEFQVTNKYESWKEESTPLYLDYKNGRLTERTAGVFNVSYNKETATITMPNLSDSYSGEWTKIKK